MEKADPKGDACAGLRQAAEESKVSIYRGMIPEACSTAVLD